MAGWITAFKVIPWAELIAAAPTVAQGARKLWASVKGREAAGATAEMGPEARQQALQAQIDELRRELTASSELIARLAEQNSGLVEAITVLRVRTRVLMAICAVLAAALIGVAVFLRS